jgi:hypothetical protein
MIVIAAIDRFIGMIKEMALARDEVRLTLVDDRVIMGGSPLAIIPRPRTSAVARSGLPIAPPPVLQLHPTAHFTLATWFPKSGEANSTETAP